MGLKQYIKTTKIEKVWYDINVDKNIIIKYTQEKYKANDIYEEIYNFSLANYCFKFSDKQGVVMSNLKDNKKEVYIFNNGFLKKMKIEKFRGSDNNFKNIINKIEKEGYEIIN